MIPLLHRSAGLLTLLAAPSLAELPYNPARIFTTNNGSGAYIFSSQLSTAQANLQLLNKSDSIDISKPLLSTLTNGLPFLSSSSARSFTPFINGDDLIVAAGDCHDAEAELWHYKQDTEGNNGRWDKLELSSMEFPFHSNFLSAVFSFSPTASLNDSSFYLFGGMCPSDTSTADQWTLNAAYSNDMFNISPHPSSIALYPTSSYESSILASRGPPVPEAGLTITPLTPTYSNTSSTSISQQQNFVLIGGHTQQAFINMSQVALFSLPEESWSFQAILPSDSGKSDLMTRSSTADVEPRSGHTAILTTDGSKIVVFGGWVGDISTPAQPQLAILELGRGYGGVGDWRWSIPAAINSPFEPSQGIYGHGAAMLEGDVMLVYGGYSISSSPSSKIRRQEAQPANTQMLLLNITSLTFVSTYTNPSSTKSTSDPEHEADPGPLHTASQKAGLGAGLVLGFSAVGGAVAVYLFYSRRLRQKRAIREKELRELALGAERFCSGDLAVGGGVDGRGGLYPGPRSASWGSREEKGISTHNNSYPWAPVATAGADRPAGNGGYDNGERDAERTGLLIEVPSPIRGLRRPLHFKAPSITYNTNVSPSGPSPTTPGDIHTIAEQDEESEAGGSLRRPKSSKSRKGALAVRPGSGSSDPFKDPPPSLPPQSQNEVDRLHREHEIQGWVEDWEAAGTAMESGRLPYPHPSSSTSKQEQSNGNNNVSRSGSPDKSDRTNSNLSEWSTVSSSSIQRSLLGTISRNVSFRSASAGYTLFANAAAAMTGRATLVNHPGPSPNGGGGSSSKRSASLNLTSNAPTRPNAGRQRERTDTFSTAKTSFAPAPPSQPGEKDALLAQNGESPRRDREDVFETPPESPVRDRSMPGPGRKALGWMGSMRRALTGTTSGGGGGGAVRRRVEEYEQRNGNGSSPAKGQQQMIENGVGDGGSSPRRAASASAAFWRGKKGARDWDVEPVSPVTVTGPGPTSSSSSAGGPVRLVQRKPVPAQTEPTSRLHVDKGENEVGVDTDENEEWDVEAAVQKRLVQVMFTVPKEKLRVVNADLDSLSLVSRSDVDDPGEGGDGGFGMGKEGAKEKGEVTSSLRMVSTVVEERGSSGREEVADMKWKGKGKRND